MLILKIILWYKNNHNKLNNLQIYNKMMIMEMSKKNIFKIVKIFNTKYKIKIINFQKLMPILIVY